MLRLFLISSLAAVLVAAAAGGAAGEPNGVVASASGGYGFTGVAAGSTFDVHPFTFTVKIYADGSVSGRYRYRQVRDGVELTAAGPLTCATIVGDRAWVGGLIEESSRASLVGLDSWFQVQDNGEGAGAVPDMSSSLGAAGAGAAQKYCDDAPAVRFPFFLDRGNLQVRG